MSIVLITDSRCLYHQSQVFYLYLVQTYKSTLGIAEYICTPAMCSWTPWCEVAIRMFVLQYISASIYQKGSGMSLILAENKSRSTYFEVESWPKRSGTRGSQEKTRQKVTVSDFLILFLIFQTQPKMGVRESTAGRLHNTATRQSNRAGTESTADLLRFTTTLLADLDTSYLPRYHVSEVYR